MGVFWDFFLLIRPPPPPPPHSLTHSLTHSLLSSPLLSSPLLSSPLLSSLSLSLSLSLSHSHTHTHTHTHTTIIDARNNKQCNGSTHEGVNFSQSEKSSLPRGAGVILLVTTGGPGRGVRGQQKRSKMRKEFISGK